MLRKRSWFSLIELLVVIGIIALLASLLLPALNRAREVGKRIVCASNMGQIGVAFQLYYNDYNGRLPPGYYTGGAWHSAPEKIVQYLPHKAMTFNHTGWNETVFLSDVYKCPSDTFFPPTPPPFDAINEDFTSYGYAHVMQMYNAITIANIKTPSTTVLAGESWKKQEYVIETFDKIPRKVCFSLWGEKIDQFELNEGDEAEVMFDLESREYNGRWYTDVKAWKCVKRTKNNDTGETPPDFLDEDGYANPNDGIPF